jgi:hypothetical protein
MSDGEQHVVPNTAGLSYRMKRLGHLDLPGAGQVSPQTNDVEVDARGLVYIVDRHCGFDILEPAG